MDVQKVIGGLIQEREQELFCCEMEEKEIDADTTLTQNERKQAKEAITKKRQSLQARYEELKRQRRKWVV